jgi:hypothetical protein
MQINQRNTTQTGSNYTVDRWYYENLGSAAVSVASNTDVPTGQGFTASLRATVTTGAAPGSFDLISLLQKIEGLNSAQLAFGSASAKQVTLSFWVRSSVTGTHTVNLENSTAGRIYVGSYTISAANTWEKKTVTISGDTTGTWLTTNGVGVLVRFPIQVGASILGTANTWVAGSYQGATGTVNDCATTGNIFAITGVQLEIGAVATDFDYRSYGQELVLCQRYFFKQAYTTTDTPLTQGAYYAANSFWSTILFPVAMRSAPTFSADSGTFGVYVGGVLYSVSAATGYKASPLAITFNLTTTTYPTIGYGGWCVVNTSGAGFNYNAEL